MPQPNEPLLEEHLAAENRHDVEAIMATYGDAPLIVLNGKRIEGHDAVREFHRSFGFGESGSFSAVRVAERARHHTAEAIIVEQTLSGRSFAVDVCTVYRFDARGRLASEHVYMDLGWLERQLVR